MADVVNEPKNWVVRRLNERGEDPGPEFDNLVENGFEHRFDAELRARQLEEMTPGMRCVVLPLGSNKDGV